MNQLLEVRQHVQEVSKVVASWEVAEERSEPGLEVPSERVAEERGDRSDRRNNGEDSDLSYSINL